MNNLNMTRGCPGLSFINTAERDMDLLNIFISGPALNSNVQVGDEFLMNEVIGNASTMKSVKSSV